jgi:RimJ/RimL family protein N-acetyltransferase
VTSAAATVRLRDISAADHPLLARWLEAGHVRPVWGDPAETLRSLDTPLPAGHGRALIETAGRPAGFIQWQHPTRAELDTAKLYDIPTSVIDIDILIGEPDATNRGTGSQAIALVAAEALSDPAIPFVIGCAAVPHTASQSAFRKAGFTADREFDDLPHGRHVLMVRRRS